MTVLALPSIPGVQSLNWALARNVAVSASPLGATIQRQVRSGDRWAASLNFPPYRNDDAGVLLARLAELSRGDRWLYLSPPQNQARGAWVPAEKVSNGTFIDSATTGWTGSGATLSINARRLKVKNSGAAIGTATQSGIVTEADKPHVLLVDLYEGSTKNWRVRILNNADSVEEHISFYDLPGRVPIMFLPSSTAVKIELGCNTAVAGDDAKFGNVSVARCLLVDDALAVGTKLGVKGGPVSTDAALKCGEYVTIRLWNGWQMVQLTEDFDSDASGKGTLRFEPALRAGVLGGGPVIVHKPFVRMLNPEHRAMSTVSAPILHGTTTELLEDITELPNEVPHDTDIIWQWDANSLSLAPTLGTGTPTFVNAAAVATYFDSAGVMRTAAANTPRFDFDPMTRALKGALYEGASQNQIFPSSDFSNAAWVKTNASITTGISDPKGGTAACTLTATSAAATLRQTLSSATSVLRTNSIFFRRRTGSGAIRLWSPDTGSVVVATSVSATEWTRYEIANAGAATTRDFLIEMPTNGDAVDIFIAQLEDGQKATSPIETTTAGVTRNRDDGSLLLNLMNGFNPDENTITVEFMPGNVLAVDHGVVALNDGGSSNLMRGYFFQTSMSQEVITAGVGQVSHGQAPVVANAGNRICLVNKANAFVLSLNGADPASDSTGTMPVPTRMVLAAIDIGDALLDGYLRRISLYKRAKPLRQAQSLAA